MVTTIPNTFGDIRLVRRGDPLPEGRTLPEIFVRRPLREASSFLLRRLAEQHFLLGRTDDEIREELLREIERGYLVAVEEPRPRRIVHFEPAAEVLGPSDHVEPPEKFELGLLLLDPWGWPLDVACHVTRPQETEAMRLQLGQEAVHIDAHRYGACEIDFTGLDDLPRLDEPRGENPDARPPTDRFTLLERQTTFRKYTRSPAYVFQLERLKATVVELEHFHEDGAVLLPGFSPAPLRENAPRVTGTDALRAALEHAKGKEHVLVTGHHGSLSTERAEGVQLLLMGNRFGWAALSARVATPEDKRAIRDWSSEPLPEDDDAWTTETWGAVFDLYTKELAPLPPPSAPKLKKLPFIVARYGKNFVPHQVALDAGRSANDYVLMNPLNPGRPLPPHRHDPGWNPVYPNEIVWLPEDWDIESLRAKGWDAHPAEYDQPLTPEPPHLDVVPRAVGCGARHRVHPYKDAQERRAIDRHAEVIVLPHDAGVCAHDGGCTTSACEVYDPRAFELAYMLTAPAARWQLVVHAAGAAVAGADVLVFTAGGPDGQLVLRTTSGAGGISSLAGLSPGSYRVVASDVRAGSAELEVTISAGSGTVTALLNRELTWHLPVPPGLSDVEVRIFDLADHEVQRLPVGDGAFDLSQLDAMTPVRLGLWTGKLQLGLETELTPGPLAHHLATRDSEALKSALRSVASPRHLQELNRHARH